MTQASLRRWMDTPKKKEEKEEKKLIKILYVNAPYGVYCNYCKEIVYEYYEVKDPVTGLEIMCPKCWDKQEEKDNEAS